MVFECPACANSPETAMEKVKFCIVSFPESLNQEDQFMSGAHRHD